MRIQKKVIIILSIILFLLIAVTIAIINVNSAPKYITTDVKKQEIIQTVEASGIINPVKTVSIGSQVSGMIKYLYVDYNSKVKKGQLLAQIDPALFQAQVNAASGSLNSARGKYQKTLSTLIYDKANYQRYKELYKKHYVAKSDLDLAEATYRADVASLSSNRADIANAQATLQNNLTNLNYTRIVSPVNGVVVSRSVDVGQTVAASFTTPTLFSVAQDLTKMQIEVSVSEADIGKVKVGQDANYTLDGYPNQTFHGKVTQVRLSPTTTSNVVTYTVIVTVDNKSGILKPGMNADVSIIACKKENTLSVDSAAMRFTPKDITGGKKFREQGLWILRKNKPVRIHIKTGITDEDVTEIISNQIKEGDKAITGIVGKSQNTSNMPKPPGMF